MTTHADAIKILVNGLNTLGRPVIYTNEINPTTIAQNDEHDNSIRNLNRFLTNVSKIIPGTKPIRICLPHNKTITLLVEDDYTIGHVKRLIEIKEGIPVERTKLEVPATGKLFTDDQCVKPFIGMTLASVVRFKGSSIGHVKPTVYLHPRLTDEALDKDYSLTPFDGSSLHIPCGFKELGIRHETKFFYEKSRLVDIEDWKTVYYSPTLRYNNTFAKYAKTGYYCAYDYTHVKDQSMLSKCDDKTYRILFKVKVNPECIKDQVINNVNYCYIDHKRNIIIVAVCYMERK
jgi:hypothetical protein